MAVSHLDQEGFERLLTAGQPMLVDFWASWCGPCKMLAPIIEALGETYDGKVTVAKVDVDQEQDLAIRYGVMSIPTVVLFQDGAEVERLVGVLPEERFCQMIDAHI